MGNCQTVCKNCYVQKDGVSTINPTISFFGKKCQPQSEYATFQGSKHYQIPCNVNHVLYDFESVSNCLLTKEFIQATSERGKFLQGYFYIIPHDVYYQGQWQQGRPHGQGEVIFKDGSVLKGWFQQGICSGPDCLHVMKSGAYYRGEVKNNQYQGKGVLKDNDLYIYEGYWDRNLPNGFGRQEFGKGQIYEGEFKEGVKFGMGVYTWADSQYYKKYDGSFIANLPSGQGFIQKLNGDKVIGQVGQRVVNKAKIVKKSGDICFQGTLVDGRPHGFGKINFPDGSSYEGPFQNGQMHGQGSLYDKQGQKKGVKWHQGRKLRSMYGLQEQQLGFLLVELQNQLSKQVSQHSVNEYAQNINKKSNFTHKYGVSVEYKDKKIPVPDNPHFAVNVLDEYTVIVQTVD